MIIDMSFGGRMASEFGITVKSHRTILPDRTDNHIKIPGIDGEYSQSGETYNRKIEQVDCTVSAGDFPTFRQKEREIAAWLSRAGRLWFSDEPDKYDIARVYGSMHLEQVMAAPFGTWTVEFRKEPFSYGKDVAVNRIGTAPLTVPIEYGGTAPARCRIIIRNTGTKPISGVRITQYIKSGGNV